MINYLFIFLLYNKNNIKNLVIIKYIFYLLTKINCINLINKHYNLNGEGRIKSIFFNKYFIHPIRLKFPINKNNKNYRFWE